MPFPKILSRLFENGGAGPKLRNDILPDNFEGSASSAVKLKTSRSLDGLLFDGSSDVIRFSVCETAADTKEKTVSVKNFKLTSGAVVLVKFTATSSVSPTLNVSGTGAKDILFGGKPVGAGLLLAGRTYTMVYDGAAWNIVGDIYTQSGSVAEEMEALRLSMIGVPRYWRSTELPADHCWANGDFVSFEDWPELKKVYDAGGFKGMLMAWDADEETQAANLGMWRPDAAKPTGLFTPNLSGQFFRNWGYGQIEKPGGINEAGIPNILAINGQEQYSENDAYGAFFVKKNTSAFHHVANGDGQNAEPSHYIGMFDASNCSSVYGSSTTVMPPSINQPVCLYLGRAAQV